MTNSTPQPSARKVCSKCGESKPLTEYPVRKSGKQKGYVQTVCRECERARFRAHHVQNRVKRLEQKRAYREQNREELQAKALKAYYADPQRKENQKLRARAWRNRNREFVARYARERYAARPEMKIAINKASQVRHPQRQRARYAVQSAVKRGEFPPARTMVCEHCQEAQAAHWHHHNGYGEEFKLDVIALCTVCHGREHQVES